MTKSYIRIGFTFLVLCVIATFVLTSKQDKRTEIIKSETAPTNVVKTVIAIPNTNSSGVKQARLRVNQFSESEKQAFLELFNTRLKPAIDKWCGAYKGHLPFNPDELNSDKFVERIGRSKKFYEYTFVIDGVTVCVGDTKGVARLDYLNDSKQSTRLMALPNGDMPVATYPVSKSEVINMVNTESGVTFTDSEVRMIQSGMSSSMNGGAHVQVGGTPENFNSWNYTLVFGSDGNLVYYCKGIDKKVKQ